MRNPRTVARHAALAFIAHGVLAVGILALDHRSGGANIRGWDAVRVLRLAESPVLWAIDGILQHRPLVPVRWFHPNFALAYAVNVVVIYVLVGGVFYAALAASVSLWLGRRDCGATRGPTGSQTSPRG